MKKSILIVALGFCVIGLSLTACSRKKQLTAPPSSSVQAAPASTTTASAPSPYTQPKRIDYVKK